MQQEWGRRGTNTGYWWGSQNERYHHYEDLDICGKIIIRLILDWLEWYGLD
jgi:hypothetical protein